MERAEQIPLTLTDPPKVRRAGKLRAFHVRSHMPAEEALDGESRAVRQEDVLLAFFRARPGMRMTPSEVHGHFDRWPITSIRRAMTGLAQNGWLTHWKADRRPGPYGSKESVWSLATPPEAA